ncbi:MAG: hypothetical protein ACOC80_14560 [Petrotogales bacterium]
MSNLGVLASKLNINNQTLKEFDESLRFLRTKGEITVKGGDKKIIDNLLNVISPISDTIKGGLTESTNLTEESIVEIIKKRHSHDWPDYKEKILELNDKLNCEKIHLSQIDFNLLNDIADALDSECTNLFRRISEG